MGSCASGNTSRPRRDIPLVFKAKGHTQIKHLDIENQFAFELSNVSVAPVSSTKIDLSFSIDNIVEIALPKSSVSVQKYRETDSDHQSSKYQLKWNQVSQGHFTFRDKQLIDNYLIVKMGYEAGSCFQIIKISLYEIVHGPYHHNIQIPLDDQIFRISFDAMISHIFQVNITARQFKLNTNSIINASTCHFTLKSQNDDQLIVYSQPSYTINCGNKTIFDNDPVYRQDRSKSKLMIKKSMNSDKISGSTLRWSSNATNSMPTMIFDVSAHGITHYYTQFMVWSFNEIQNTAEYLCDCKIPLWKMFDKKFSTKSSIVQNKNSNLETRKITLIQKIYAHHELIGNCEIEIDLTNQKIIEQTKYCSRTEEGIVNMRPSAMNITVKSSNETLHEIWKLSQEIQQIFKKFSQKNAMDRYENQISELLLNFNLKLTQSSNEILYSDSNRSDALINNQKIFLQILERMYPFVENTQNPALSQLCWSIIIHILTGIEFRLQNLSLKGRYASNEALQFLKKKKSLAIKYNEVCSRLLTFALKGYGLYHKDNSMINYFMAFAFFRIPSFREYFFKVIEYEDIYAAMEEKLIQFQNEIEPKTSFGFNFAQIKGDWKNNFYDELANDQRCKSIEKTLVQSYKSKKWFMEISYKDDVLYDFISILFETLGKHSAQKVDKWKYIEGYSKILAIIMTELKTKEVNKYQIGLIRSSIQLLENQHLLTPMLPLICDKTNVYDGDNVQIVLDLLEEYLIIVTKKKTTQLPSTFNQNYFFKLMRTILEGEDFNSISKLLLIIFHFFEFFNSNGRYQISMYFMGRVFFKLYYHWSKEIRHTFYMFLQIRIKHINHQKAHDIIGKLIKVVRAVQIIEKIYSSSKHHSHFTQEKTLYMKLKTQLSNKRRKREGSLGDFSIRTNKSAYALENIMKLLDEESFEEIPPGFKQQFSYAEKTAGKHHLQRTMTNNIEIPNRKERTYSESVGTVEEIMIVTNAEATSNEEIKFDKIESNLIKKRRPSVFSDNNKISPINTTHYTSKNNELHDLTELTDNEIKNIGYAKAEMAQVAENIAQFSRKNGGALPNDELLLKVNEIRA